MSHYEDIRYMKIHIFALRWKDEIRRSSQLRTLLKRVVVRQLLAQLARSAAPVSQRSWVQIPYGPEFFQVLFTTTRFSSVLSCEDLLISCRTILEFLNFRVLWQWPTWVSEIDNQYGDKNQWYLVGHVILLNICLLNCFIHRNWPDWSLQSYKSADQIPNYYNGWIS